MNMLHVSCQFFAGSHVQIKQILKSCNWDKYFSATRPGACLSMNAATKSQAALSYNHHERQV